MGLQIVFNRPYPDVKKSYAWRLDVLSGRKDNDFSTVANTAATVNAAAKESHTNITVTIEFRGLVPLKGDLLILVCEIKGWKFTQYLPEEAPI